MAFGTPVSNKFQIGSAEVRIGPMTLANKLTQAHSMGLLESATVNYAQESVDLEGGLPKTLIDTVITKTNVTIDASAYEYSRRNIQSMINLPADSSTPSEYSGEVAVQYSIGVTASEVIQTTLPLASVTVGDILVLYSPTASEKCSVVKVTAKIARSNPNEAMAAITVDGTKTPLLFEAPVGTKIFKTNTLGLGKSVKTNYFTLDVLGLDHASKDDSGQGRPKGFKFWKVAVSGGMNYSFSNDNFAVTPMQFKVLQPSAAEYASGGPLEHVAALISDHPFGMFFGG